ncbi:MAG: enoyl-CoA hydratase/isomerase family protein [Chloroflexi bacterium]|nr:enoyl-CoA hydratase/isomerase family protein [Chloroflexota bacterium]
MSPLPALETLRYTHEANVATITLQRPEAANTFNETMFREFYETTLHALTQADTRAILLNSTGNIFCAGGDLSEFARSENLQPHVLRLTTLFHSTLSRLARAAAPVITAVQGSAGGAGMALVLAADLVLASENARFTMAYTAAGLAPDGSSTFHLPRLVGLRRALELTLTNRRLSAQEALGWGIVNRVLPAEALQDEALALARQLAAGPALATAAVKRLLHRSFDQTLETQLEDEAQAIAATSATHDAAEGIRAFLEKRPPIFRGE